VKSTLEALSVLPTKSFLYKNMRVTATRRGIIGGDMETKQVVWRQGLDENPEHEVLMDSLRFFGTYFFYRSYYGDVGGALVDIKTGKTVAQGKDLYLVENNIFYLDATTFTNITDRNFSDITVLSFDTRTKKTAYTELVVDQYIDRYCSPKGSPTLFLEFAKKLANVWYFRYSGKKCDIEVNFKLDALKNPTVKINKKR
jgi:hypothetical protein